MATTSSDVARLEYNAAGETLRGVIGTAPPFHMVAYSGGSRGHKANVSQQTAKAYLHAQANTLTTRLSTTKTREDHDGHYTQRGGTLPPGHYRCHYVQHHSSFGECIRLFRMSDALAIHSPFASMPIPHGRDDDFYIHGSGPKGSDGCIVPANNAERMRLNKAVRDFPGTVILHVTHASYMLPAEVGGGFA
jgi:hypothetical protein